MERRLAAILAADMVGYSRLMAADESGTIERQKAHRDALIDPTIAQSGGRIVKTTGDGMLVEFPSVVDAVQCAVEIQRAMPERELQSPDDQKIQYRIGINLGDIVLDGDDILGDGVNIAARLEAMAEPGGICVSQSVHAQVKGKLDLAFEDLGERQVKNIPEPIRVFRVALDSASIDGDASVQTQGPTMSRLPIALGSLVGLVALAGIALWQWPDQPREEPADEAKMAFPLPDKPSIAVLPFNNLSDDSGQEYFADGITEDLITDLSKISGLFVIARNSSFSFKGQQVKVRQVAEELGVRYILEGSVRRAGDAVRINAQLIDATSGGHLWAERYDGTLADVFQLQDKVTARIVEALALELTSQEVRRLDAAGTDNVEAHDAYLLGLSFYHRRTADSYAKAVAHFEKAIALDPAYTAAYTALAKIYVLIDAAHFNTALTVPRRVAAAKARQLLTKAQARPDADVHVVRSSLALRKHQHKQAIAEAEQALTLKPNDIDALEALSAAKTYSGQPDAGIEHARQASRQSPTLVARPILLMGLAEFALGNLDKATEHLERAFELGSEELRHAGVLAAAYGLLGNVEQAKNAFDLFQRSFMEPPDLSRSMAYFPFSEQSVLARLAEGLELAGVKVWFGRADGGYLPLHNSNRLDGAEIDALLSGKRIEGKEFWWRLSSDWQRQASPDGAVEYSGFVIQPSIPEGSVGTSRIDEDRICERWQVASEETELCSVLFRVPGENARKRWGDYVLVTDTGPHPFRVME